MDLRVRSFNTHFSHVLSLASVHGVWFLLVFHDIRPVSVGEHLHASHHQRRHTVDCLAPHRPTALVNLDL